MLDMVTNAKFLVPEYAEGQMSKKKLTRKEIIHSPTYIS